MKTFIGKTLAYWSRRSEGERYALVIVIVLAIGFVLGRCSAG